MHVDNTNTCVLASGNPGRCCITFSSKANRKPPLYPCTSATPEVGVMWTRPARDDGTNGVIVGEGRHAGVHGPSTRPHKASTVVAPVGGSGGGDSDGGNGGSSGNSRGGRTGSGRMYP